MSKRGKNEDYSWVADFRREHIKKSARNPGLAALMSFFIMGSGQIYAGHIDRGIILLFVHFFSIFAGYNLYSGGFIYEWLMSTIGPHLIIVICYFLSVIFILTWIYNIKDAYYLSIFSSFRDWFEVERVLLPSMGVPVDMLISDNKSMNLLEDKSLSENNEEKINSNEAEVLRETEKAEDIKLSEEDVINVTAEKTSEKTSENISDTEEDSFDDSAADLVFMNSNIWKSYASLILVIVLLGIGMTYYYNYGLGDTSFQISGNFESNSYSRITPKTSSEVPSKIESKTPQTEQSIAVSETINADSQSQPIQNQPPVIAQQPTITQQQVEAYVDQRIRSLLDLKKRVSESFQFGLNNRTISDSDEVPLIISGDVANSTNSYNEQSDIRGNGINKKEDYSNQVVFIQGHKEAKLLNKTSEGYENERVGRGVVLYEAPENEDVELIMTDEGNANNEFPIESTTSEKHFNVLPFNEVAQKHVVPNIDPKLLDNIKEEAKAEKEKASDKLNNEDEVKGKVLFERNDESLAENALDNTKEKPVVLEPQIIKNKAVKAQEPSINFESSELRAKLEKIKERGAHEFYNGNWEAALPFYFEVLKYRRNAESFEMVGIIFEKMNKLNDAFEAYENAYSLGLDTNHNVARLGLIAEKIGEYEKAQKYLEKAIENNPKRADIILSYARCLNKQGEGLAAAQVLAVLRDSTKSYAIKKAAEQEYQKIIKNEEQKKQNNQNEIDPAEVFIK